MEKIEDLHKIAKALLTYETLTGQEIENIIKYQVGALMGFIGIENIQHVKPHGALYNKAVKDENVALSVINSIKSISEDLIHVVLALSLIHI